ncbi:Hypothetical predicted protein [Olea europaea subsp. europaea]|uniref:Uncharacterized protein n=1 Tax=Olea europaea subsp. europaea TaxID=158383 RepID=A0A8S0QMK4_OLEEU|nr:Hypothetical predicted protein [Olea europaea subsp. europaea]
MNGRYSCHEVQCGNEARCRCLDDDHDFCILLMILAFLRKRSILEDLQVQLAHRKMFGLNSVRSIGLGPMCEEDSTIDVPESNVPQEDPVEPLPNADERTINLSDEECDIGELDLIHIPFLDYRCERTKRGA